MTTFTQETTETPEAFCIDSDRAAEWLLRRLGNIEAEKARVTAQAAAICRQLDQDAQNLRHLYESQLIAYARHKLSQAGNRRRTLTLLQGSISLRTVPPSLKVSNPAAALIHAQESGLPVIKTTLTLDAAGYRDQAAKHYRETGELLPGMETTPEHETHRITFGQAAE